MNVQWYPGHMTKAMRQMQEDIKLIDIIIELIDARIPLASKNPDIDKLGNGKARLIIMNKCDLADDKETKRWEAYYRSKGFFTLKMDARKSGSMKPVVDKIEEACAEKLEKNRRKGIINRPLRAMIAGIPNVGKSTLINSIVRKGSAKVGDKPGVTKGKQWIKFGKTVELLDTPGVLWPKFEDKEVGMKLAAIGSINDTILDMNEIASYVIDYLQKNYCNALKERYNIEVDGKPHELLERIAVLRGALKKGGEADSDKAALLLVDDLRSGRLGRISLEKLSLEKADMIDEEEKQE